jgi:tetratricopeptide (TPR) repeat protein
MKPAREVEQTVQDKLQFAASPTLRRRLLTSVLSARANSPETERAARRRMARRTIMKGTVAKLAAAAAVILVGALGVSLWNQSGRYAIAQTVEALQNVRFIHLVRRDSTGQVSDERWIEVGMDGWQVRYRQDNPAPRNFGVIEDGQATAEYRHDKKAVIVYDREDKQYQWVGQLGEAFENLRQEGKILETNGQHQGRPAHKVWWPMLSAECYVDPDTKLPFAIADTELSYETPPAGTFEIVYPEGYAVLDKREGAEPGEVPDWLLEEERAQEQAGEAFRDGLRALLDGKYVDAVEALELSVAHEPRRNWAWFWLGSAYYGLGQYDQAVEKFTRVLEILKVAGGGGDEPLPYCHYARGLAYAGLSQSEAAQADLALALPAMIQTLRIPSTGALFEYADNPRVRSGYRPSEREMLIHMVNRLRVATGQNFGYDPLATAEDNETAVTAWEQWFETDGRVNVTFDAELLSTATAVKR